MENKINIAELLKDCPKGIELYSPLCGECYFDRLNMGTIICKKQNTQEITFTSEGYYMLPIFDDCECVLFPSKENRDWSKFQRPFKDGDILSYQYKGFKNRTVYIYMQHSRMNTTYYVALSGNPDSEFMINDKEGHALNSYNDSVRFATEEEKAKLFQAIKDNGYKWNAETKTLDKLIEPKFKVGDKVLWNYDTKIIRTISKVQLTKSRGYVYWIDCEGCSSGWWNENELTPIPSKFDINTFKPFQKVLVRDSDEEYWSINLFGFYNEITKQYCCMGNTDIGWDECIPYEGNEHLLGTTNDCDEYYKNW